MNNETKNSRLVTGLFNDRASAERAYEHVTSRGYGKDDVNVLMSDDTRKRHFGSDGVETELGSKAAEGAGIGAGVGGAIGAALAGRPISARSLSLLAQALHQVQPVEAIDRLLFGRDVGVD